MKTLGKARSAEESKRIQGKNAYVYRNEQFISIGTSSGAGILGSDPQGSHHLLPLDASDEALGDALIDALSKSRYVSQREDPAFSIHGLQESYKIWVKKLTDQYKYKNRQQLFKDMVSCNVRLAVTIQPTSMLRLANELITMQPTRHERLNAWGGIGDPTLDIVLSGKIGRAHV